MKFLKIAFYLTSLLFVLSCVSDANSNNIEPVKEFTQPQPFDTLAYLERHNTEDIIYKGTKYYVEILKNNQNIEYDLIYDAPYLEENFNSKFDSIFSVVDTDTLFLSHSFFMKGRSGNEEFGFLEKNGETMYLKTPWLDKGWVEIIENDTIVNGEIGCDCAGVIEQKYKIPLSKLENTEYLYFKGKEIKFK